MCISVQCKKKLAMFDLDGTLFNTCDVNFYAYREALKAFNIELDYEYFQRECNGKKYTQFLPEICGFADERLMEIHRLKKENYARFLSKAVINAELFDILEGIRNQYHIALVTTASKKNTMELLRAFHKEDTFDFILTQDDIEKPKPDPEGFLKVQAYFNVSAEDTIIFEDSEAGLAAALQCTKKVYMVKGYR